VRGCVQQCRSELGAAVFAVPYLFQHEKGGINERTSISRVKVSSSVMMVVVVMVETGAPNNVIHPLSHLAVEDGDMRWIV
jgi:hypothetical protein